MAVSNAAAMKSDRMIFAPLRNKNDPIRNREELTQKWRG
jgi:hypothetical protein